MYLGPNAKCDKLSIENKPLTFMGQIKHAGVFMIIAIVLHGV